MPIQQERIDRILDLILLLTDDNAHNMAEICQKLGMNQRVGYYLMRSLRDYGFSFIKERTSYRLNPNSPFFRQVALNVSFNDDEAALLYKLADTVKDSSQLVEVVKAKLLRFYDIDYLCNGRAVESKAKKISSLYDAMDRKRVVILKDYSSPHSQTVSDRAVEPFLFMNDKNDVRCYELASGQNKTFKLSRIGEVQVVDDLRWGNESQHRQVYTDIFLFSGEEKYHVQLRLGQLSHNLLLEEYPLSARCITPDGDHHWLFETDVVSYVGIGRFVLGLSDDIEVLADDGLRDYLRSKADSLYNTYARE